MAKKYDFSGWATKNDVRCADGRIIRRNAFADQDGARVPLFWNHQHNDPEMVLGHAILMNKEDGVYAYASFNNSAKAQHTKEAISHGDLFSLSIYANQLRQNGSDVLHGVIRELSVVPGGANPDALIDSAMLAHGDAWDEEVLLLVNNDENIILHSDVVDEEDDEEEEKEEKKETKKSSKKKPAKKKEEEPEDEDEDEEDLDKEQEEASDEDENEEDDDEEMKHSAETEKTVGAVLKTLNDDQKKAVAALIEAIQGADDEDSDTEEEDEDESEEDEEETNMKHNVFDNNHEEYGPVLSHSDMQTIFQDWKRYGSLKDTIKHHLEEGGVLAHTVYNHDEDGTPTTEQTYGMADINYLFPDARKINAEPELISRQMDWVKKVMNGTRHTPFSRVKSVFADITMDEARAKGYIKGNLKAEEVFALLKRVTTPQTIYKKQKLDRDDIVDITDFNVVAWLKAEMRLMLEEEAARAILIGDGRSAMLPDKISEEHIRPIYKDAELFTIRVAIDNTADEDDAARTFIRESIKARKRYKGSGNLVLFTTADVHTNMILLEDQMGRPLYDTEEKLRSKLRVSDIVDVEVMEGASHEGKALMGIFVDLRDYNVGADKGGEVNFFDDFDIDYNQEKYLIESRFSGALVKPYSAIVVEMKAASSSSNG